MIEIHVTVLDPDYRIAMEVCSQYVVLINLHENS